ncbi:MAG: putative membrane protein [Lentimonas sp.]|jgi:putative membrane protein
MKRTLTQKLLLSIKGMAMGAADVVPGVSGGTIAFITGIYEELITSIDNINLSAIKVLRKEGLTAFWNHINGTFFLFLFAGIILSIASLAKIVVFTLEESPVLIWSFFFGLILASTYIIGKTITNWTSKSIVAGLIGLVIALFISSIQTVAQIDNTWYIFLSGAVAICAMILPGISGSFILVLMGSYHLVLNALKEKELFTIVVFLGGCVVGLLSFSKLLKFLFTKYKTLTIAVLTGFMLGSLYKVWPWKINTGDAPLVIHSDGKEDWMQMNVWPAGFDGDAQIGMAILCCLFGLVLVIALDKFSPKDK